MAPAIPSIALAVVFGAAVGSFVKLCADRLPGGKSILWPPSHCEACGKHLQAVDLVPVLSYIWLRGRCRHCGAPIPPSAVVVEAICAAAFGLIWSQTATIVGAVYAIHASLLVLVALIDLKHHLILNKVTYPWAVLALVAAPFVGGLGLWNAILGGVVGAAIFAAIFLASRGGMGLGDVKLAGVIGLTLGLPLIVEALALAAISGGIAGAALLVTRRKGRKDELPFGVFLAIGAMTTLLWGQPLWDAYLRFAGWSR